MEEINQPYSHEDFMREVSQETLTHLVEVEDSIKAIKSWISFFGVMSIIGGLLWLFFYFFGFFMY